MGSNRDHLSAPAPVTQKPEEHRADGPSRGPVQGSRFQAQLAETSPRAVQAEAAATRDAGPANTKSGFVWALARAGTGKLPSQSLEDAWNYARGEPNSSCGTPPVPLIDKGSSPSTSMNRAEAAKVAMLARYGDAAAGAAKAIHFHDAEGAWYSDPAHAARAYGVIEGFEDNSFRPGEPIADKHAEALATKAARAPDAPISPKEQVAKLTLDLRSRALAAGPGSPGVEATFDAEQELTPGDAVEVPAKHLVFEQLAHRVVYEDKAWLYSDEGAAHRDMLLSAGYSISPRELGGGDGLYGQLFVPNPKTTKPAARPVLVFRGTDLVGDLLTDTLGADLEESIGQSQYHRAVDEGLVRMLAEAGKADVTGHSLGGALAQHAAVEHPQLVAEVVTFQAPGIGRKAKNSGVDPEDVTHYLAAGDRIDDAGGDHVGGRFLSVDSDGGLVGMEGIGHTQRLFESSQFDEVFDSLGLDGSDGRRRVVRELAEDPARAPSARAEEVLRLMAGGHLEEAARILREEDWPPTVEASLVVAGAEARIVVEGTRAVATLLYASGKVVVELGKAARATLRAASDLLEQGAKSHGSLLDLGR